MTKYERRQKLLELLVNQPGIRVPDIARELKVSLGTVRNDLNALEAEEQLMRVHGGAVLSGQGKILGAAFSFRHDEHSREKSCIGQYAARLVNDGDSVLLDASSTVYYLALYLKDRQRLRVVTNGIEVARLLAQNPTNTVLLIGGLVTQDGSSVTGLLSEQIIDEMHIQKAFVSCSGFTLNRGLMEVHLLEAQLKRRAMASSKEIYALVDSSKIGKEDLTPFASLEQITHLYTDTALTEEWMGKLKDAGISFTMCENEERQQSVLEKPNQLLHQ